ncbi:Uncharacterised protein [Mycobacterium tuberculosis]|nr:Uncharacterised protein [Mycobacterium tuberculosis]
MFGQRRNNRPIQRGHQPRAVHRVSGVRPASQRPGFVALNPAHHVPVHTPRVTQLGSRQQPIKFGHLG